MMVEITASHPQKQVLTRAIHDVLRVRLPRLPILNKTHFNSGYE